LTEVQSKGGSQTVIVGQRQLPPVKCSIMWTANC